MEFLFLGPLAVRSDEREVTISAPRQRVVLATLLLNPNNVVPVDRIARFVWDDPLPPSAAATVRTYVMRLRQTLGESGSARIVTRAPGYLLRAAEHETDLGRFHAHRMAAKRLAERDDLPGAVAELDKSLGLWRNEPFLDVPSPRLRDFEGARLRELRLQVFGWRVDMQLSLRRHAELLPELRQIVREQPLNEAFVGRLMLALARAGQRPEALDLYQRTRAALIGEIGMEPGVELRAIQGRILRAEDEPPPAATVRVEPEEPAAPEPATPAAEAVTPAPLPAQLPPASPDLTARGREVAELAALLGAPRAEGTRPGPLAVITGGPGAGKTSLLLRAAHAARDDFPDGQLYASIENVADPAEVAARFLVGLGVPEHAVPGGSADRLARYRSIIVRRRVLVVLDDATCGSQVVPLLPASGESRVLVSSRYRLVELGWSRTIQLEPLDDDESLELLASGVGRERLRAEPEAARWIARACGGLPLALRVAGLRLMRRPGRRLDAAARRLADPQRVLDELEYGDLSVRAALDRAHDGLAGRGRAGGDLRLVLRRLGMVSNCCIRPGLVGVLLKCPTDRAEELLDDLADAHLLSVEDCGCYRMSWLTWLYVRERLYREEPSGYYVEAVRRLNRYRRAATEPGCATCPRCDRPRLAVATRLP
ncbi:BTAD domain-containing putative transcriptional regulator [Micromonospora sp. WMMD882]|uniref:AfsR/SARP family transcriptional regulator n=1 Tax=Micromonospora sp. WMMD882 TaxID=3015151 RepID=UPI00248BEC66|nr:BTAD domain-containing putative transcriptional regulator [Micromonospora sp. WMMD882]WBB80359.1 BTAD domain-containing putative transcriptional regulator [Micromonospora sp. WMMD882]